MVLAMMRELEMQRHYLDEEVETIYFGGGTPSILPVESLRKLLKTIHEKFHVSNHAEVTLEANPDDLMPDRLAAVRTEGVNRLSIGIQSFDDDVLRLLHRAHSAKAATKCLEDARAAGFANISIDLIYAIPGQPLDTWKKNIDLALTFRPEHISAYSLTIEEKTVFGRWSAKGKFAPVSEELSAEQLDILQTTLDNAGYEQYEISNFSLPGYYSRHNSSYWKQQKYLGVGPSAHSYNLVERQYNVSNNHEYLRAISSGRIPATIEKLSKEDRINDYLLTTLRTSWGADLSKLKNELEFDIFSEYGGYITNLVKNNLAVIEGDYLRLTSKGRFVADKISSDLFVST
jgi:oxygen-independent coproporphyrinogen III oxidase